MRTRLVLGGLGVGVMGAGSFAAALVHYSRRWIAPPRVRLDPPRCEHVEEARFAADDGTPLYGWFLRAGVDRPGLVVCHGYQRSMEETFALACDLRECGFNVLAFDFRGCGRSGGRYTTLGNDEPLDVVGARDWLRARLGADAPVGVLGISMGGSVALTAAARRPEFGAVVADSAFATLQGAVAQRFAGLRFPTLQLYQLTMRTAERLAGRRVAAVRPVDAARWLERVPVLLIHGTADSIVPYTHALELHAALPGPHELWTLDGVGHAMARFVAPDEYLRRVAGFFSAHLRAPALLRA